MNMNEFKQTIINVINAVYCKNASIARIHHDGKPSAALSSSSSSVDDDELLGKAYLDYMKDAAHRAGIEPGELVGTGNGFDVDEDGYRDFGLCSFCGIGHYICGPHSLFAECDVCGDV